MNLLIYITSFILIFSIVISGFFQKVSGTQKMKTYYTHYLNADRKTRNKIERDSFKNLRKVCLTKEEKRETSKKEPSSGEKKDYCSHRLRMTENSKLNLQALMEGDNALLMETLENLLEGLYQKTPFYQEGKKRDEAFTRHLVKEVLMELRKMEPSSRDVLRVTLQQNHLQEIWYQMLMGACDYDSKRKQGYPPLTSFVTIDTNKDRNAVVISKAAKPVLRAFLGKEKAEEIFDYEKEKYESTKHKRSPINKKEVEQRLTDSKFLPHKKLIKFGFPRVEQRIYRTSVTKEQLAEAMRKGAKGIEKK